MSAALSAAGLSMRRAAGISRAFFRMGWNYSTNYPLGFWLGQVSQLLPVVIFYFISQLSVDSAAVGGDYYTFVILGFVGMMIMAPGVNGLSYELEAAMINGHWEMLLVEPVPWRLLPFTMVVWPTGLRLLLIMVMVVISTLLGAVYDPSGLGVALLILVLGLGTGLAIGVLSSSVKVLAKKGDPVLDSLHAGHSGAVGTVLQHRGAAHPASHPGLRHTADLRQPGAAQGADASGGDHPRVRNPRVAHRPGCFQPVTPASCGVALRAVYGVRQVDRGSQRVLSLTR